MIKQGGGGYDYLSLSNTKALRGIMALTIILCHSRNRMLLINDTFIGSFFTALAYLVVGMFFFLTGYGLHESAIHKVDYKKKFFRHRIIPFYVDCLIFITIYTVYRLVIGQDVSVLGIIGSATVADTYVMNGWYLQAVLIVYFAFWIAWRIDDRKYEYLALSVMLTVYITIYLLAERTLWVQSILGIPLGYLWSASRKEINQFISKHYCLVLLSGLALLGSTVIIGNWYTDGILQVAVKAISVCCFIVVCVCVLQVVPIQNKLFMYLGNISFELYVVHGLWIDVFGKNINTWGKTVIFLVNVIVCSILTASILHVVTKKMNHILKQKT